MSQPVVIDLRSDTVTKPCARMRQAMAEAEVGDDVYREDPTVNRLERVAAEMMGKEAALFVPSGTMGNTIAIKLHTRHGEEVICEARSHVLNYELSMMAWFAGCVARPIPSEDGILSWDGIRSEIRPLGPHWAPTGAVTIENTHNMAGGTVYPPERIREIAEGSHALGLKVHMDGARVFNAAAATGVAVREIVAPADTVMFCLSKGLGAPVGSILAGTERDMERARLYRKRLGGGMRQAGVLAAAGLIALEETPPRLVEDHANARFLADGLASLGRVRVSNTTTNIVIFDVSAAEMDSSAVSAALKTRGVLINGINPTQLRAVTHRDVSRADCERALTAVADVLKGAVAAA